jgi:hypothetical protein
MGRYLLEWTSGVELSPPSGMKNRKTRGKILYTQKQYTIASDIANLPPVITNVLAL